MNRQNKQALIQYLSGFVSESRWNKFQEVVLNRTRHLTIALEDIYQPHNASAVLRSCDCFGIQDIHIVENRNAYTVNPDVALGSSKWLNLNRYGDTLNCIHVLREKGYRIVATSPHANDTNIDELEITAPTALFFGTELEGISETVKENADAFVKIPMFGFTESFNISVSAALCLHTLTTKLHKSDLHWRLGEEEKENVLLEWLRASITKVELIENAWNEK